MKIQAIRLLIFTILTPILMTAQQKQQAPDAKIDYAAFLETSEEVHNYRQERLISLDTFVTYQHEENTLVLDTRSAVAYQRKHIKGAVHLNFSDFTAEKLAKIIPSKTTRILIYCNNNIKDDPFAFPLKNKPLALNIPTFINLYGYGYTNVYELSELISVTNAKVTFSGTTVE